MNEITLPQDLSTLGNRYFYEHADENGLSLLTPEYEIALSKTDPVLGQKIVDICWTADRDGEMFKIEMDNGKQIEVYLNADGKIEISSD